MKVSTPGEFELWEGVMWAIAKDDQFDLDIAHATTSHYWAITHIDWIKAHRPAFELSDAQRFLAQLTGAQINAVLDAMTDHGWFTDRVPSMPKWVNIEYVHNN